MSGSSDVGFERDGNNELILLNIFTQKPEYIYLLFFLLNTREKVKERATRNERTVMRFMHYNIYLQTQQCLQSFTRTMRVRVVCNICIGKLTTSLFCLSYRERRDRIN